MFPILAAIASIRKMPVVMSLILAAFTSEWSEIKTLLEASIENQNNPFMFCSLTSRIKLH